VLLYILGGHVCFSIFYVAMCVFGSFIWQVELLGLLGDNVCCWVF